LTPREKEMTQAVVEGLSNQQIAERFQISIQTVKKHLSTIYEKTGCKSRTQLAVMAVKKDRNG
jgi:two-component system nitrate/nitrite response regulator NarL